MSAVHDQDPARRPSVAWLCLLLPGLAHLLVHLMSSGNYGILRDEYYYLACADRLDWGYVDHPPLSILILAAWKSLFSDSLASIRVLPALAGAGQVMLTGLMAAEMGGRRFAQILAAVAMAIGPLVLVQAGFYSMNPLDFLFWTGACLILARFLRGGNPRLWLGLGILLGLGLQNKIGLLVFGSSLVLGLLLTKHRRCLA